MSLLNRIFKPNDVYKPRLVKLKTKVLYSTADNFIILINYGYNDFYSMIEFISGLNSMPDNYKIHCVVSDSSIEQESTDNTEFRKTPNVSINDYYAIIAGEPKNYAKIYDYIDSSNSVLEEITKDIYNYCNSIDFKDLIDIGILAIKHFKYGYEIPKYNQLVDNGDYRKYDDIKLVSKSIPSCFSLYDLCKMFNIYTDQAHFTAYRILAASYNRVDNPFFYKIFESNCNEGGFYTNIISNPCLENLSIIVNPIYLKPDMDEDTLFAGEVPKEQLDEIFQKEYDRFVNPTVEYSDLYKDIDEILPDDYEE